MTRTGGCLCSNIRFAARGEPGFPHSCSCSMCRRHTGAPTAVWVEYSADAVDWTGPGDRPATYRSSKGSSRAFCPVCGSSIGAIDDAPVIALLAGAFDDPSDTALRPLSHSFADSAPSWWHSPGE